MIERDKNNLQRTIDILIREFERKHGKKVVINENIVRYENN